MTRFFTEVKLPDGIESVQLDGDDARHAREVLRMRPGDRFVLCDGAGRDHGCVVTSLDRDGVRGRVESVAPNRSEPVYEAVLYQGIPKGDKLDDIVRKAVELGAARIVPVACARSVARWESADRATAAKVDRLRRIAREAAKQCGRGTVPEVGEPLGFDAACREAAAADLAFVPWESERGTSIRSLLTDYTERRAADPTGRPRIAFLIGPEGGFDAAEAERAAAAGIRPVSLGRRILRTETAGPAVLAMLTCLLDEFPDGMVYNESPL